METASKPGILLERIWPPCDAPPNWISQVGGDPNLPPELEWPTAEVQNPENGESELISLDFLAQIDLSILPHVPDRELLPAKGILFFFAAALSPLPFEDFGSDAFRVLYFPGDVSKFPTRPAPADSGWYKDNMDFGGMASVLLRDPDQAALALFPRCPVRAVVIDTGGSDDASGEPKWQGSLPPSAQFEYPPDSLPYRVEDGLLLINALRNEWREATLPFKEMIAQNYKFVSAAPDIKAKAEAAYNNWLVRAKSAANELKTMHRTSLLHSEFRDRLNSLVNENQEISKMLVSFLGRAYPLEIGSKENIAIFSIATLFRDFPEFAASNIAEGAAAHPAKNVLGNSGQHRMLGSPVQVQEFGHEGWVNLLQIGSDIDGPRFMWWDAGNLSFYIAPDDLKEQRFDRAKADIFGH